MKRTMKHYMIYFIGVCMLLISCDIETSNNGNLDGYWHLVRVDTLATNVSSNLSDTRIFWGVQMGLIQIIDHDRDLGHYGYLFNFEYKDNTLRLYNAHKHEREKGDILIEDVEILSPLGINESDDLFAIEKLNSNNMILRDHKLRLWFDKM